MSYFVICFLFSRPECVGFVFGVLEFHSPTKRKEIRPFFHFDRRGKFTDELLLKSSLTLSDFFFTDSCSARQDKNPASQKISGEKYFGTNVYSMFPIEKWSYRHVARKYHICLRGPFHRKFWLTTAWPFNFHDTYFCHVNKGVCMTFQR